MRNATSANILECISIESAIHGKRGKALWVGLAQHGMARRKVQWNDEEKKRCIGDGDSFVDGHKSKEFRAQSRKDYKHFSRRTHTHSKYKEQK